jgi:hypothetical protein
MSRTDHHRPRHIRDRDTTLPRTQRHYHGSWLPSANRNGACELDAWLAGDDTAHCGYTEDLHTLRRWFDTRLSKFTHPLYHDKERARVRIATRNLAREWNAYGDLANDGDVTPYAIGRIIGYVV